MGGCEEVFLFSWRRSRAFRAAASLRAPAATLARADRRARGTGGQSAEGSAAFDFGADLQQPASFYDFPYPSDLRLTDKGTPDLTGLPFPNVLPSIPALVTAAMEHPGFPVVPVAYFRFSAPLPELDASAVIPADKASPILLVDVDPDSPSEARLTPMVATTPRPTTGSPRTCSPSPRARASSSTPSASTPSS